MRVELNKKLQASLLFLTLACLGSLTNATPMEDEAIPIDSLEPLWIDQEKMDALRYAPVVELEESVNINENGITEYVWNSRSPFTVNDKTIEEHEATLSVASKLDFSLDTKDHPRRALYNTTEQSNECKTCIDNTFKWCPTSNYQSGYCCNEFETCPRAVMCSDEFQFTEIMYMLCPNELGCLFARTLVPPTNGNEKLYENIEGKFQLGDLCSYKIAIPSSTDLNDMMYLRIEYLHNAKATLIKGYNLLDPIAMYSLDEGHNFSATKDINFFLLFEATNISSGDFVFKIWYNNVSGSGQSQPTRPDYPAGWVDPFDENNFVEPEAPDNPIPEAFTCETTETEEECVARRAADEAAAAEETEETGDGGVTVEDLACFANEANCNEEELVETVETIGGNSGGLNEVDETGEVVSNPFAEQDEEVEEPTVFVDDTPDEVDLSYDPFGLGQVDEVFTETDQEQVTEVTGEELDEGMSKAGTAFLWLFIIFILLPALLVLAMFLTAKYYPKSQAGENILHRYEMFQEMMAKRKENKMRLAEQRALEKLEQKNDQMRMKAFQGTIEGGLGSEADDIAISKAEMKQNANKVYPATDSEDRNFTTKFGAAPVSEDEQISSDKRQFGKAKNLQDSVASYGDQQRLGSVQPAPNPSDYATQAQPSNPNMAYVQQMQQMQVNMMASMKGQMSQEQMNIMMQQQQMMMQLAMMQSPQGLGQTMNNPMATPMTGPDTATPGSAVGFGSINAGLAGSGHPNLPQIGQNNGQPFMTNSAFFPKQQETIAVSSGRTHLQADLEQPGDISNGQFGALGVKKVKKIKKVKKKPTNFDNDELPYQIPNDDLVNRELFHHDISPLGQRPNINANTIDHPGSNSKPNVLQPQDDDTIPALDGFDPNSNDVSVNAPLGNLVLQDSEGVNADVDVDDDFDYDDVQIQGADKSQNNYNRQPSDDDDFL